MLSVSLSTALALHIPENQPLHQSLSTRWQGSLNHVAPKLEQRIMDGIQQENQHRACACEVVDYEPTARVVGECVHRNPHEHVCVANADNDWKWCQYEVDVADEKGNLVEQQLLQGACCECPPAFLGDGSGEHDDEREGEDGEEREHQENAREDEDEDGDEDETDAKNEASSVTGMFQQLFDTVKDEVERKLEGHDEDQDDHEEADHDTKPKDDTASAPGFAPDWQPVRLHVNGDKFSSSKAADAVWHKLYAKDNKPTTGAPAPGFAPGWEPVRIHVNGDKYSDSKAADVVWKKVFGNKQQGAVKQKKSPSSKRDRWEPVRIHVKGDKFSDSTAADAAWHKLYGIAKKLSDAKSESNAKIPQQQHKTIHTAGGLRWELSLPKFTLLRPGASAPAPASPPTPADTAAAGGGGGGDERAGGGGGGSSGPSVAALTKKYIAQGEDPMTAHLKASQAAGVHLRFGVQQPAAVGAGAGDGEATSNLRGTKAAQGARAALSL